MKNKIYLITTILLSAAALCLSSCLKDSRYVDFSKVGTIVEFPLGGQVNFGKDAITDAPADDANGTITRQFAINVASPTVPTTATSITLSVDDPAIVTKYDNDNTAVSYLPMPANAYVFTTTSVTIPAGQRIALLTVTFYKNLLDPSKSYMLPIAIKSAGGLNISGNMGIHYYHFIGNPFAGNYTHNFSRYNGYSSPPPAGTAPSGGSFSGATDVFSPILPTQFEVVGGYYTGTIRYEVSFTQVDATHFENFNISLNSDDVSGLFTPNSIIVTQPPVFGYGTAYAPDTPYTYAEALQFMTFQMVVTGSGAYRFIVDNYVHQ